MNMKETLPTRVGGEDGQQPSYLLGSDELELERLSLQGRLLAPATREILVKAGIRSGMSVLDLGCGVGDASFVAADLVGPTGRVVGIDASGEALALANARAERDGVTNVQFLEGDVYDPAPGGPFDAVTARLVLIHVPDPCELLRIQASVLRPGGLFVPIDVDIDGIRYVPSTPLGDRVIRWVVETFRRSDRPLSLGSNLWSLMEEAGLHPDGMTGIELCFGPDDPANVVLCVGMVRTLLPIMEKTGVATAEEIDIASLQQRLAAEVSEARSLLAYPPLFGAWATIAG